MQKEVLDISAFADSIVFFINGEQVNLRSGDVPPDQTLLEYLRQRRLTGTKLGCGMGGCGACTVAVATWDPQTEQVYHRSVNACLTPVMAMDGAHIVTIEGLGDTEKPHALQTVFARHHATQCGFCTPGFIMSLYSTVQAHSGCPTLQHLESAFDGNLCRCTGYRPILDAAKTLACDFSACQGIGANGALGELAAAPPADLGGGSLLVTTTSSSKREEAGVQALVEEQAKLEQVSLAFPELLRHRQVLPTHLSHSSCSWQWFAPTSLVSLLELAARLPRGSRFYSGNTDFTEQIRHDKSLEAVVSLLGVPDLRSVHLLDATNSDGSPAVSIGLAEPLTKVRIALEGLVDKHGWPDIAEVARAIASFGSSQMRNWCGLGSLLLRSELVPILVAAGAEVIVQCLADPGGDAAIAKLHQQKKLQNKPPGSEDTHHGTVTPETQRFFAQRLSGNKACSSPLGGPSMALAKRRVPLLGLELGRGEVATRLLVPVSGSGELVRGYRGSLRRDGAFSTTAAGFRVVLDEKQQVATATLVASGFGGWRRSAAFPQASAALMGQPWPLAPNKRAAAVRTLVDEAEALEASSQTPKGHYRKALVASFLKNFLSGKEVEALGVPRPLSSGVQQYELKRLGGLHACPDHRPLPADQPRAPVGEPLPHSSVMEQATGEALYVDDLPIPGDCLWAACVASKMPKGRIRGIDFSEAVRLPGVFGYFDYRDFVKRVAEKKIPANNAYKVFTTGHATAVGHCIGITVAESSQLAKAAAELVRVDMEEQEAVFTVDEALERQCLIPYDHAVEQGDASGALEECRAAGRVVEGEIELGGQEHFYLEPHAVMAVPGEGGEMTIYSCTQCIHKTQKTVAEVLGVPSSKVTVKVKRMGGAFGGKEVLSTFLAARLAVAARRLRRPVRILLDRTEDMEVSGQRHPFLARFKCGFSEEGKILAYTVHLYANAGHTTSITKDVMNRAISHAHNAYHIPNFRAEGTCCDTNWYSFTAFRGFGAPQSMLAIEVALEKVAAELRIPVEAVRLANLLPEGGSTPYGQLVEGNLLKPMWEELWSSAEVGARMKAVEEFNSAAPPYRRRGLSVVPTKYGVNFPVDFLNASGAFVCIYQQDATVLVCHGGTEMGQGLNIKVAQIAANALGCDVSAVHVGESASDKVPNAPPTAASVGSDVNGMAVLDACEKLARRLQPYRADAGDPATWKKAVQKAYLDRVSLFAEGYYSMPDCGSYDWGMETKDNAQRGKMFAYHTFGVCCAEVEVDFHTGEWACLRADVLMDVGSSINPAVDIGQVEGAFVQGMGYYTLEELHWAGRDVPWARPGTLVTNSPHSYKIPAASDVPYDFRVKLFTGAENPRAVHSSKAVGEPPTFLSAAVFLAIKRALSAVNGVGFVQLDSPATTERIRMACDDIVTREVCRAAGPYHAPKLC